MAKHCKLKVLIELGFFMYTTFEVFLDAKEWSVAPPTVRYDLRGQIGTLA